MLQVLGGKYFIENTLRRSDYGLGSLDTQVTLIAKNTDLAQAPPSEPWSVGA